jgi:CHAD domain-containing protein
MASVVFEAGSEARPTVWSVLVRAGVELQSPTVLDRTRYDTLDGRLFAVGVRAELRTTDRGIQELVVAPHDGAAAHLPLAGQLDPTRPLPVDQLPPGALRRQLQHLAHGRAIVPQVRCRTQRRSGIAVDGQGAPTVIVHVDEAVALLGGPGAPTTTARSLPPLAIEVVGIPGRADAAGHLCTTLAAALQHGGRPAVPLEGDALELVAVRAGVDLAGWRGPSIPRLHRRDDALDGTRAVLRSFAEELDRTWEPAADHLDDEALHAYRIAIRQTRSLLAESRHILPKPVRRTYRDVFGRLGTVTSHARDLDVQVAGWTALIAPLGPSDRQALEPVLVHLAGQRATAHDAVAQALRSRTARASWEEWRDWLDGRHADVHGGRDATRRLGAVMAERVLAAHHRLVADGRRIDAHSPAAELHELRKDGKRLRYLLEGFGQLGGRKRAAHVIRPLKDLQDDLGAHQDAEVQAGRLRRALDELAGPDGPGLEADTRAAGTRLLRLLGARQAAERERFAAVFAAYDRRKVHARLCALTDRMAR